MKLLFNIERKPWNNFSYSLKGAEHLYFDNNVNNYDKNITDSIFKLIIISMIVIKMIVQGRTVDMKTLTLIEEPTEENLEDAEAEFERLLEENQ